MQRRILLLAAAFAVAAVISGEAGAAGSGNPTNDRLLAHARAAAGGRARQ